MSEWIWVRLYMFRIGPFKKLSSSGLPWWRSGWESACQCRGHGFEPWSGKIPHATEQLGPWATTTEPVRLELVLRNKRGHDSDRPVHHDEEWPPLSTTRESPSTEMKTQHSQKERKKERKFKKKTCQVLTTFWENVFHQVFCLSCDLLSDRINLWMVGSVRGTRGISALPGGGCPCSAHTQLADSHPQFLPPTCSPAACCLITLYNYLNYSLYMYQCSNFYFNHQIENLRRKLNLPTYLPFPCSFFLPYVLSFLLLENLF